MSEFAPDIIAFLEARLSEAELLAKESLGQPSLRWQKAEEYSANIDVYEGDEFRHTLIYDEGGHGEDDAEHIVFWQPARALALVASHRRIIDRYKSASARVGSGGPGADHLDIGQTVALGEVLIDLASLWREHPDWHTDWEVEDK